MNSALGFFLPDLFWLSESPVKQDRVSSCNLRRREECSEHFKTGGKGEEPGQESRGFESKCLPINNEKNLDSIVHSWVK